MVRKIAIHGKARAGKNTLATIIQEHYHSNNVKLFAFADPIKEMIMIMYPGTDREILWGPSELRSTPLPDNPSLTYRDLLMELGKIGRKCNLNLWANSIFFKADEYLSANDKNIVVITDLRFYNEFILSKSYGYSIIKIIRPGNEYIINDISEKDLDSTPNSEFNSVFVNDSTVWDLELAVSRHFDSLRIS